MADGLSTLCLRYVKYAARPHYFIHDAKVRNIFEPCKFFVLNNVKDVVKLLYNLALCVLDYSAWNCHYTN